MIYSVLHDLLPCLYVHFGTYTFELEFMNRLSALVNICLFNVRVKHVSFIESRVSWVLITLILCIKHTGVILQILHII